MSTITLCAFCESLPERSPGQVVKTIRCPLCKTDLGVSSAGDKFRVAAAGSAAASSGHGALIAVVAGFGAAAVFAGGVLLAMMW